jgi:anti-sigma factor RsiW
MRCSSSEALLDAYVEGTLDPRRRALVAAHLATCDGCTSLLEEFRVIDALLLKPRTLEPAANFTFKVMAEVRDMPRPHVHRVPTLAVLGTYVVFAWAILGAFFLFARGQALAAFAAAGAWVASVNAGFASLARATGHVFGRHTVDVTAAMGSVLAADAVVAAALFALYNVIRSRRLAAERIEVSP